LKLQEIVQSMSTWNILTPPNTFVMGSNARPKDREGKSGRQHL
jgi:hypothetical protein